MAQPQVTEELRPRGVYSIDQILGVNNNTPSSPTKNIDGKNFFV